MCSFSGYYADAMRVCTQGRDQFYAWSGRTIDLANEIVFTPSKNFCLGAARLIGHECKSAALLTYAFVRDNWAKLFAIALAWAVIVFGLGILNGYNFTAISIPMAMGMGCGFGLGLLSGVLTVKLWPEKPVKRTSSPLPSSDDETTNSGLESVGSDEIEEEPLPIPEEKRSLANLSLLWLDKLGIVTQSFVISVAISIAIATIPHFPLAMGVIFGGTLGNYLAVKAGYGKPLDFELRRMWMIEERLEKLEAHNTELQNRQQLVDDIQGSLDQMQERLNAEKNRLAKKVQNQSDRLASAKKKSHFFKQLNNVSN